MAIQHAKATQANGRFLAIPGRRGKPSGVGPSLRITSRPSWSSGPKPPASCSATRATRSELGGGSDPEDRRASGPNERQAPLGGDRWRRQRLGDGDAELVRLLLLRPAPDDPRFGSSLSQRRGSPPCAARLRARSTLRSGSAAASGMPGAPPPEPTSTIGPSKPCTTLDCAQAVLEQHPPGLAGVGERGQPRRLENRRQPAPRRRTLGKTTTTSGSARCLRSPSRRRRRPRARDGRSSARRPSSARARRVRRSAVPARPHSSPAMR